MKNKIGILGNFGSKGNMLNGQTIKTQIIFDKLGEVLSKANVLKINTAGGVANLVPNTFRLMQMMYRCKCIIIFPANNALRVFVPLMSLFNLFCKCKLHYVVIGGWLVPFLEKRPFLRKLLLKFDSIYVETNRMKTNLERDGFTNIVLMPNCKTLNILSSYDLANSCQEPFHLCIFSRVMKEKGIEDAIYAVKKVNKQCGKIVYTLDIYGQVDPDYQAIFTMFQQSFPNYIKFKGTVPFDKTTSILKGYFALLFPTKFYTEGVPGTIIDAYSAGLPIIASRWENFSDVIVEGKVGLGYNFGNVQDLVSLLLRISKSPQIINLMREDCLKQAKFFSTDEVVSNILLPRLSI